VAENAIWKTVSKLLAFARKLACRDCQKPLFHAVLRVSDGDATVWISSAARYDHFDTPPQY